MAEVRPPTDVVGDDLLATYAAGVRRLEGLIRGALERYGLLATA